jgi:hypothetical protein
MHSTKNNGLAAANNQPAKTLADRGNALRIMPKLKTI